jgi:hypothetical protein
LTSEKFLEALGSGIGTGLVFCLSFSVLNNVGGFENIGYHWMDGLGMQKIFTFDYKEKM